MDQYDKWDDSAYTLVVGGDMGSSHVFTSLNKNESGNKSIKLDFGIYTFQS